LASVNRHFAGMACPAFAMFRKLLSIGLKKPSHFCRYWLLWRYQCSEWPRRVEAGQALQWGPRSSELALLGKLPFPAGKEALLLLGQLLLG
jgi:hypothetical protein